MKVLTFMSNISLGYGGPARSVPMLVKGLSEIGVDITLMTIRSEEMNTHALDGTTAKLHVLEKGWTKSELEKYVLEEKFNLIQNQSVWDPCYHTMAQIAQKHHIPYIVTPRGMLEPWSLAQKKWKKKLAMMLYQRLDLQKAACIFTTADMEAQHVRELGIKVPCSVIPNGIETNGYPCRISADNVQKQILFLSRIHVKKGIEILIEAFNRLQAENLEFKDWSVVIVGNGETDYIESLKQKVKNLGLENSIKILPPVFGKDKIELYQSSSIFCLPSYSENFGMVIAEAMSCGVPVITTTNCPWNILNETDTGWCIDLGVDNLEKALRESMSMSSVLLFKKGQAASRLIQDNFNYKSVANKARQLYDWILNKRNVPDFVII